MTREKPYCYEHPRPALTTDAVVFGYERDSQELSILLVERKKEPYQGKYAFPGGFVDPEEKVEDACHRELKEETGIELGKLKEFGVFSDPERDPRGRVISIAFLGLVDRSDHQPQGGDDASSADWAPLDELDPSTLAFDHEQMLERAIQELNLLLDQKSSSSG